jgi:hypothetical protein
VVHEWGDDNRSPGRLLEDTSRSGNLLLSGAFARAHGEPADRAKVAPFLLFDKPGGGRDVRFRGLLAPGSGRLSGEEDLVAVWRTTTRAEDNVVKEQCTHRLALCLTVQKLN